MKTLILAMMLVMQTTAWAQAPAAGGTEGGNGGDPVAAEVAGLMLRVVGHLRESPGLLPDLNRDAAEALVLDLRVDILSGPTLVCDIDRERREVVACNYETARRVEVARGGWLSLSASRGERFRLAAHELLGLMGMKDPAYRLSGSIMDSFRSSVVSPYLGEWVDEVNARRRMRVSVAGSFIQITEWDSGMPGRDPVGSHYDQRTVEVAMDWIDGSLVNIEDTRTEYMSSHFEARIRTERDIDGEHLSLAQDQRRVFFADRLSPARTIETNRVFRYRRG